MAAVDEFANHGSGGAGSADRVFGVTPSDTAELPYVTRAIRADGAGIVRVITRAGGGAVDCRFAAGETRPIRVRQVLATGTTATGLEGMA